MAVIGSISSLRVEDFPTERDWIGKLLFPVNQFFTAATGAINGNIAFGENIPGKTFSVKFTYGGTSDFPKLFKWDLMSTPVELRVCSAFEDNTAIGLIPVWYFSNGQIYVTEFNRVSGGEVSTLTADSVYNIVLRAQP